MLVEFVSANPTGPVTAAGGRGAAYGDSLARLLGFAGHEVEREYYMNDTGSQVRLFAESIAARMRGAEPPADGYAGEYVAELAEELSRAGAAPDDLDALGRLGTEAMRSRIEATLERFGVRYDTWFSERSLQESGALEATIAELRERGHVYESEGAVWLRTTSFGDDKDRVLIRADGEPTYFATDIAYHRDKLARGPELMLTPLGADHHGYVPRMRAAIAALGADPDRYEAPIMQLVNIVEGGERAQMSKRRGEFVTLDELIDDIGADATRFFLLQRSHDTSVDLDLDARPLDLAGQPGLLRAVRARADRQHPAQGGRRGGDRGRRRGGDRGRCERRAGARRGGRAGRAGAGAAAARAARRGDDGGASAARRTGSAPTRWRPRPTSTPSTATAGSSAPEPDVEAARLGLCVATMRTIAITLDLLGVSAPERM